MSLTKYQYPNVYHQGTYPDYYTCLSDNYTDDNFKYKYELYTEDGLLTTWISYPSVTGGLSYTNPNKFLSNLFELDFDPDILTFTSCPGSIKEYELKVIEINGDADKTTFSNRNVLNISDEDFSYSDYILSNSTGSLLTPITFRRKVDLTNNVGTFRFLSGILNTTGTFQISYCYEILLTITRSTTVYEYKSIVKNPYYTETTIQPPSSSISDKQKYLLEFPATPKLLNDMQWTMVSYTVNGHPFPPITAPTYDVLEEGDTYTIQTYNNVATSLPLSFEVSSCKSDQIEILWENELGGFDFFNFNQNFYKNYDVSKSTYQKVRDSVTTTTYGHTSTDRGLSIFKNEIETSYTLNSDWVQKYELEQMESLFYSKNVFALIEGDIYPVIGLDTNVVIKTNALQLNNIQFNIKISNKKYN